MTTAKEVTSQIWEMANRLRGNMDASEYRNYILGFMFYRYLSERQEKYLFDNKVFDENPNDISGIAAEYAKEANGEYLADYLDDIAGSLGYAIGPQYSGGQLLMKYTTTQLHQIHFKICLKALIIT